MEFGPGTPESHGSGLDELLYEVSGATHGGIEERGEAILHSDPRCLSVKKLKKHVRIREKLSRKELLPLHPAKKNIKPID